MPQRLYAKLLFATDLGPQSFYIGQRACALAACFNANMLVLHVIEPLIAYTAQFASRQTEIEKNQQQAQQKLTALCTHLAVTTEQAFILHGKPDETILKFAKDHDCNLIIVGSHGIGGYLHALGSTTNMLLNTAECDILTVQVTHLKEEIAKIPSHVIDYEWQFLPPHNSSFAPSSHSPQYGSQKGFSEAVRHGLRPVVRPPASPYRGGTRKDEEQSEKNPTDENSKE